MFRIRDMDELRRMIAILKGLNNSTVKFPVDIFRDAEQISAVQCGSNFRCMHAYTKRGHTMVESPVQAEDLRHSLHAREDQFEKELDELLEELEEEEANVQDTES